MRKTSQRIGCAVLIILLLIGAGGGIYWYLHQTSSNTQTTQTTNTTSTDSGVIPASTAPFKAFNNTEAYRFTVSYPSDWTASTSQEEGTLLIVSFDYQVDAGPDDYPLEIDCNANPNGLTAQQWSEAQQQLTSQGPQKLANGLEIFVATGLGEGAYTAYSVVQGQQACTMFAFATDAANTALINKVINTFAWHA